MYFMQEGGVVYWLCKFKIFPEGISMLFGLNIKNVPEALRIFKICCEVFEISKRSLV